MIKYILISPFVVIAALLSPLAIIPLIIYGCCVLAPAIVVKRFSA